MTSLTSMCELACQIVQKNLEKKQFEEEQAAKAQNQKLPVCYDDDDDEESSNPLEDNIISELPPYSAVTPSEPIDSLNMGDEHLNTIPVTESDEFIKSCVENHVPNPSESEGENECDVPAGFTTFSNVLFDADYDSDSSDDQSLSDEDVSEKIYSNPLFNKEIIPMEIDQHSFNAESDLIESLPNHDSSIIISSKIDSLFDDESYHFDIPSPYRPPAKPPDGKIGTLNIKMLGDVSDQKVPIPGLTITRILNQEKYPDLLYHQGFEAFQPFAECPMIINGKNIPLLDVPFFHFYPP
nr:hypothetical protein [Tanacetum cinerariifolium]